MSWPMVELGSIANFINGFAFKPEHWEEDGKPIIRIQNLTDSSKSFNYSSMDIPEKYHVVKGDLLVSWSATLDVFEWRREDALLNQHIFKVEPNFAKVNKDYLRYALRDAISAMLKFTRGSTMKHVNRGDFLGTKIPLPPLETQKQIAEVLEKADQLRKDCQQMEQELNSLAQSVFIDMFGDPVTNPKGWDLAVLSDVVKNIQGGKSPKCDSRPAGANEWGVLKLSAVTGGFYKPNQNKAILEGTLPNSDIELKQGDLLFTRKNTYELVGACAYVRETPDRLMLPDLIFRFHMPEKLKIYFWGLLNNTSFKLKVRALASGAAGSMPNIAKSKLNMLELPLPSEKAVLSYTNAIQEIWEQQITLKQLLSSYQEQFDVLMQKAFKGELDL
ncbi:restriction endonuclease subunit S [Vibrio sp. 10N.286.51.F4]|uniref:restriction endonuclease subunit S n=1 Tax=Vibrio sp. 10N.286.51.F4 TaxID=3229710 RepID=UPI00354BFFA4